MNFLVLFLHMHLLLTHALPLRVYVATQARYCSLDRQDEICFARIPFVRIESTDRENPRHLLITNVRLNAALGNYMLLDEKLCASLGLKRLAGSVFVGGSPQAAAVYDDAKLMLFDIHGSDVRIQTDIRVACRSSNMSVGPMVGLGAITRTIDLHLEGQDVYSLLGGLEGPGTRVSRVM